MSTIQQPDVMVTVTPGASVEVKKFMDAENVDPAHGGLRVSVQPGGCSGFKYGLLIEDAPAEDDLVVDWPSRPPCDAERKQHRCTNTDRARGGQVSGEATYWGDSR